MQRLGGDFEPNAEVDELRWLPIAEAADLCTHDPDRLVLADLARTDVPLMPTLLLVRHARAGDRSQWDGPDDLRPSTTAAGSRRGGWPRYSRCSARPPCCRPTAARCRQTFAPLAERLGCRSGRCPSWARRSSSRPGGRLAAGRAAAGAPPEPGVTVVCSQAARSPRCSLALGVEGRAPETTRRRPRAASGCSAAGRERCRADYYRTFDADPDAPG